MKKLLLLCTIVASPFFAYNQAITVNGVALTTESSGGSPTSCNGDYKMKNNGVPAPSIAGNCITLTDGTGADGEADIWICSAIDLTNDFNFTFTANFGANLNSGDGIAFVLNGNNDAPLGGVGGNIGYGTLSNTVAVEFDTWADADMACHHAEINQDGISGTELSAPVPLKSCCGSVLDGADYDICISWDVSTLTLTATFDGNVVGTYTGDIAALIGTSTPNWGLTSGCGAAGGQVQTACSVVMDNQAGTVAGCTSCTPPTVTVTPNPETICSGETTDVAISGDPGTDYCWQAVDNLNVNGETSTLTSESSASWTLAETLTNGVPGNQTVTYTIYPESSSGCFGTPIVLTVDVMDPSDPFCNCTAPNLVINPLAPVCDGTTVDLATAVDPSSDLAGNNLTYHSSLADANGDVNAIGSVVSVGGTYYFRLEDGADPNCFAVDSVVVTINPNPTATISPDPAEACAGVDLVMDGNPAGGSGVYTTHAWTGPGSGSLSATNVQSPTFNNATSGTYDLTYTVTDDNGCTATDDITVTVNDNPTATISPDPAEVCAGVDLVMDGNPAGGSGVYTTHAWTGPGSGSLSATNVQSPTFNNATDGTYDLTYTVTDDNGCTATDNITVTVFPGPTATISPDPAETCAGVDLVMDGNPAGGSGSYTTHAWTGPGSGSLSATNVQSPTFNNATAGTYDLTYTLTDDNGCTATDDITVTVNDNPTATISPDPAEVCAGVDLVMDGNPAGGSGSYTTHSWTGPGSGSLSATNVQSPTFNNATDGTYDLTYTVTDDNGCTATDNITVTVFPGPTATISPDPAETCAGVDLVIDGNPAGGSGSYTTHAWTGPGSGSLSATNVQSPTFNNATAGTYDLTYTVTDDNGCTATDDITVTVNDNPTATISPDPAETCAGTDLVMNGNPAGGSGVYTTHAWTNTGAPSLNATNIVGPMFNNATGGTYDLTYTVTDDNGCIGTDDITVTVFDNPVIASDTTTPSGCNVLDGSIQISLTSGPTATGNISWTGTTSGGPQATTLPDDILGLGAGSYNVTFTDANGCVSNTTVEVIDNPGAPSINAILDTTACATNYTLDYSNITGTNLTGGQAFYYNSGGVNPILDDTVFTAPTNITVFAYDNNGSCDAEISFTITINENPTASIIPDPAEICAGQDLAMDGNVSGGSGTYTTHSWTGTGQASLDNATIETPIFNNTTGGSYDLTYTVTDNNGCSATDNISVTVNDLPNVNAINDGPICAGQTLTLTENGGDATSWSWTSTNGTATINTPGVDITTATGATNGEIFQVLVTDGNGCQDSTTTTVTVNDNPVIATDSITPSGCNLLDGGIQVTLVSGPTSNGNISWTGTTSGGPQAATLPDNIAGLGAGSYDVTFTDANGCISNTTTEVLDNPGAPVIDVILDTTACATSYTLDYSDITGTNLTGGQAFYYSTGGVNPILDDTVFTAPTNITVFAYDNNGLCNSEVSFTITINENPTAVISPDPAEVCAGADLVLDGNPAGGSGVYTTHAWTNTGSGSLSATNVQSPTFNNATDGTYDLTYTVTDDNGCSGSDDITVTVDPLPTINVLNSGPICIGQTVTLTEDAAAGTSWSWTTTGAATINTPGADITTADGVTNGDVFQVLVTDGNGCQDSTTTTVTVNALPSVNAINDGPICVGQTVTLTEDAGAGTTWSWTTAGAATINTPGADITTADGVTNGDVFQVLVTDGNGCQDSTTTTVTVNALPSVNAINDGPICDGQTLTLTEDAGAGTSWSWTSTNGTATINTPTADITTADGVVDGEIFQVLVTDGNGCQDSTTTTVTVNSNPTALISPDPAEVCSGNNLVLNGTPSGGSGTYTDHLWTNTGSGSLDFTDVVDPTFNNATGGVYDLTYTVTDDNGCTGTDDISVTVFDTPTIDAISDTSGCASFTFPAITGTNVTASASYWTAPGGTGTEYLPGATYSTAGTITLYAYDGANGCSGEVSFNLTINELPTTTISGGATYCEGDAIADIVVTTTGTADFVVNYTLDGVAQQVTSASTTASLGNAPGTYVLVDVSDMNCANTASGTEEIIVNPLPLAPTVDDDATYCDTETPADITAMGGTGTFTWYSDDLLTNELGTGDTYSPDATIGMTSYYVTETENGCEGPASEVIITIETCEMIVPTAFTPNNDFIHDTWEIVGLDDAYPDNVVRVYNRWGSLLFEHFSNNGSAPYSDNQWDGTYNGEPLPVASYYYIIETDSERTDTRTGTVTIIRE